VVKSANSFALTRVLNIGSTNKEEIYKRAKELTEDSIKLHKKISISQL